MTGTIRLSETSRRAIFKQWLDSALALFPEKMGYSTPVAVMLSGALEEILSCFETGDNTYNVALEDVTRMFAIQNILPSRALSIFFELKIILRDRIMKTTGAEALTQDVQEFFNERIDDLVLEAFDSYMRHREKLYQLKVEEGSRRMYMALRRAEA